MQDEKPTIKLCDIPGYKDNKLMFDLSEDWSATDSEEGSDVTSLKISNSPKGKPWRPKGLSKMPIRKSVVTKYVEYMKNKNQNAQQPFPTSTPMVQKSTPMKQPTESPISKNNKKKNVVESSQNSKTPSPLAVPLKVKGGIYKKPQRCKGVLKNLKTTMTNTSPQDSSDVTPVVSPLHREFLNGKRKTVGTNTSCINWTTKEDDRRLSRTSTRLRQKSLSTHINQDQLEKIETETSPLRSSLPPTPRSLKCSTKPSASEPPKQIKILSDILINTNEVTKVPNKIRNSNKKTNLANNSNNIAADISPAKTINKIGTGINEKESGNVDEIVDHMTSQYHASNSERKSCMNDDKLHQNIPAAAAAELFCPDVVKVTDECAKFGGACSNIIDTNRRKYTKKVITENVNRPNTRSRSKLNNQVAKPPKIIEPAVKQNVKRGRNVSPKEGPKIETEKVTKDTKVAVAKPPKIIEPAVKQNVKRGRNVSPKEGPKIETEKVTKDTKVGPKKRKGIGSKATSKRVKSDKKNICFVNLTNLDIDSVILKSPKRLVTNKVDPKKGKGKGKIATSKNFKSVAVNDSVVDVIEHKGQARASNILCPLQNEISANLSNKSEAETKSQSTNNNAICTKHDFDEIKVIEEPNMDNHTATVLGKTLTASASVDRTVEAIVLLPRSIDNLCQLQNDVPAKLSNKTKVNTKSQVVEKSKLNNGKKPVLGKAGSTKQNRDRNHLPENAKNMINIDPPRSKTGSRNKDGRTRKSNYSQYLSICDEIKDNRNSTVLESVSSRDFLVKPERNRQIKKAYSSKSKIRNRGPSEVNNPIDVIDNCCQLSVTRPNIELDAEEVFKKPEPIQRCIVRKQLIKMKPLPKNINNHPSHEKLNTDSGNVMEDCESDTPTTGDSDAQEAAIEDALCTLANDDDGILTSGLPQAHRNSTRIHIQNYNYHSAYNNVGQSINKVLSSDNEINNATTASVATEGESKEHKKPPRVSIMKRRSSIHFYSDTKGSKDSNSSRPTTSYSEQEQDSIIKAPNSIQKELKQMSTKFVKSSRKLYFPSSNGDIKSVLWMSTLPESYVAESENLRIGPELKFMGLSTGLMELDADSVKSVSFSKRHHMSFLIIKGQAEVQVHNRRRNANVGVRFVIPKGAEYDIRNIGEGKLVMEFMKMPPDKNVF